MSFREYDVDSVLLGRNDVNNMLYCYTKDDTSKMTDELMIANMLNFLNNPILVKKLDDNELKLILSVIKNHIVLNAEIALSVQQKYLNNRGRSR